MNTTWKKNNILLKQGTVIMGKWHRRRYHIIRHLGTGTVGSVYLCRHNNQLYALKLSEQSASVATEVQALKTIAKMQVQGNKLGPYLVDVDDWVRQDGTVMYFYVMEYIKGDNLRLFIQKNGSEWIGNILYQLLERLEAIHNHGYIFGDLKNDNIIMTSNPSTVRLIDVGGMTKMGRTVKEYTNFFDRAYWRLGKRLAEPSYDLFAVVMVVLAVFYPKKFVRRHHVNDHYSFIKQKLLNIKLLRPYTPVLLQALSSKYPRASHMKMMLMNHIYRGNNNGKRNNYRSLLMEILLISSCTSIYIGLYYVIHYVQ